MTSAEEDSVLYWNFNQPQVEPNDYCGTEELEDEEEYDIIHPATSSSRILRESDFYANYMPHSTVMGDSFLTFCSSFPIQVAPRILNSLIRRFTDCKFNWETQTLRSFLEVFTTLSAVYMSYKLYGDLVWALQLGFVVGMIMSICDEFLFELANAIFTFIKQQPWGYQLLRDSGFEVQTKPGQVTKPEDLSLLKTVVFGYLGLIMLQYVEMNSSDIQNIVALSVVVGVTFVTAGELFCLWLPTRRFGLTVQSRWTNIKENWENHYFRSLLEVVVWLASMIYIYYSTFSVIYSVQLGTLVGLLISVSSGLDELSTIEEEMKYPSLSEKDGFLELANKIVRVEQFFWSLNDKFKARAIDIMDGFSD